MFVFVIPFSFTFFSILKAPEKKELAKKNKNISGWVDVGSALGEMFWPIFGEFDILSEIKSPNKNT